MEKQRLIWKRLELATKQFIASLKAAANSLDKFMKQKETDAAKKFAKREG